MIVRAIDSGEWGRWARARLEAWSAARFGERLRAKDPTLWSERPLPELADRLGWIDLPRAPRGERDAIAELAREVRGEGARQVALLGMGGSSLAPEVFHAVLGGVPGAPSLVVVDSTHPGAVRAAAARLDPARTLFVVSSKSGTTLETLSFFRFFWERAGGGARGAGARFIAITDPGTPLERLARERGFRRVAHGPPDVGGRYSALSAFGLLPAALVGADIEGLVARARAFDESAAAGGDAADPALGLGALLAECACRGRDKLTLVTSRRLASLPAWIEQLVAESLGKGGKGIVPVAGEDLGEPSAYGADRVFVAVALAGDEEGAEEARLDALGEAGHPVVRVLLEDPLELGAAMLLWEVATAAAGAALGVNPFDQPDVELAKELARRAMSDVGRERGAAARGSEGGLAAFSADEPASLAKAVGGWLASARPGDYVAVQAFLEPDARAGVALAALRLALRDRLRVATTLGWGPRFLHSTGQLHKGGPGSVLALQIVDEPGEDVAVPEAAFTFGAIVRAQALGDASAIAQRGRRILRVSLGRDAAAGLDALRRAAGTTP